MNKWTKDDEKKLSRLVKNNRCTQCISKVLGRTEDSVRNKASELGISLRPNDSDSNCVKC